MLCDGQDWAKLNEKKSLKNAFRPRSHGTGSAWSPYQFEKSQDEHDS